MNKLQMLITEKLAENKSYRRIAEECGLNHVSLAKYHRNEVEPDGKTLAVLGKYFNVDFWELMQNVRDSGTTKQTPADFENTDHSSSLAERVALIVEQLHGLSPSEQLEVLERVTSDLKEHKR